MSKILLVLAIAAVTMTACKEKPGKGEPGANLLDERCGRCHPTGVKKAHSTRDEWDRTVTRMMSKGAALNNDEKVVLLDFLVKYYQP